MLDRRIPRSLERLAENNSKKLKTLNIDRVRSANSFDSSQKSSHHYLNSEFLQNQIDSSPDGKFNREGIADVPVEKQELVKQIMDFDTAMIVIRPEMFHTTNLICDFLVENGFKVNFVHSKQISIKEYFELYKEVIRNVPALSAALPSRTLTYTNAESAIVVFTDPTNRFSKNEKALADGFFDTYKGAEGRFQRNTIRGEIVYNQAIKLGFNTLKDDVIARATDPFGAYKQIIRQPGDKWYHLKTTPDLYLLMYNGQGIHLPNSSELYKDIATLHTCDQLSDILQSLIK